METAFLFIVGFVMLIRGGGMLVDGAVSLAKYFRISPLIIGLTVVAFGTSAPELVVNIVASAQGNTDIAIGNVLGSNIANILLVLGITALIHPLPVKHNTTWKEIPFGLLAVVVLGFLVNDTLLNGSSVSILTRGDGLVLLSFLAIYMYYIFNIAKNSDNIYEEEIGEKSLTISKSIMLILWGLLGLSFGGNWVVDGAVHFAQIIGVSQSFIALTVVALGTSLPELTTSVIAARKKQTDIAIGTVVGSNILNVFWVLGISAIIRPLPFHVFNNFDIGIAILASIFLFSFLFLLKPRALWNAPRIEKKDGILFLIAYIAYISFLIFRG